MSQLSAVVLFIISGKGIVVVGGGGGGGMCVCVRQCRCSIHVSLKCRSWQYQVQSNRNTRMSFQYFDIYFLLLHFKTGQDYTKYTQRAIRIIHINKYSNKCIQLVRRTI